jgi:ribonuclease VapC
MIVETSALVAIVKREPGYEHYIAAIAASEEAPLMSAANLLEAAIIVDRLGNRDASRAFSAITEELEIEIAPFTEGQALIARTAYTDFGKGTGHKAQLNFGDCFAYALAKDTRRPLLFKGTDFSETDIIAA